MYADKRSSIWVLFFCAFLLWSIGFGLSPFQRAFAQRGIAQGVQEILDVVRPDSLRYDRMSMRVKSGEAPVYFPVSQGGSVGDSVVSYPVGSRNVSWVSREGVQISALVFYPTVPPVDGQKFSAVIFSHGLGGDVENFVYLGRAWAERGIVTICLRHPESDESIWRGKLRPMGELKVAYNKYWSARDRARAIRSGIDFLYAVHDDDGPLGVDLDLNKIGVAGNDLGALGALLVAGQLPPDNGSSMRDTRVAGVLALSPPVFCDSIQGGYVYAGIAVPVMVITGTQDDGIVGTTKASQRRLPYDCVRDVDKYLVILQGGDHRVYGGRRLGVKQGGDLSFQNSIRQETADFWSAYLLENSGILHQLYIAGKVTNLSNAYVEWQISGK